MNSAKFKPSNNCAAAAAADDPIQQQHDIHTTNIAATNINIINNNNSTLQQQESHPSLAAFDTDNVSVSDFDGLTDFLQYHDDVDVDAFHLLNNASDDFLRSCCDGSDLPSVDEVVLSVFHHHHTMDENSNNKNNGNNIIINNNLMVHLEEDVGGGDERIRASTAENSLLIGGETVHASSSDQHQHPHGNTSAENSSFHVGGAEDCGSDNVPSNASSATSDLVGSSTIPSYTPSTVPVAHPNENDVLLGRGGRNNQWSGNENLRTMARNMAHAYAVASKRHKPSIALQLVQQVRVLQPPGRYVVVLVCYVLRISLDALRRVLVSFWLSFCILAF